MKRRLSDKLDQAKRAYLDEADGMHPQLSHLVEVFADDRDDLSWSPLPWERYGQLWIVDEDGYDEMIAADWDVGVIETTGFSRDEIARLKEEGEWPE